MFHKFIEEKLCKNVISIKMQRNFIEITLLRENNKNTSGRLLQLVTPKQPTSKYLANGSNFLHPSQLFSNFYGGISM